MGWAALFLALCAGIAVALPSPGLYLGIAAAILGGVTGLLAYRRRRDRTGLEGLFL
jgi:hypothetical protein